MAIRKPSSILSLGLAGVADILIMDKLQQLKKERLKIAVKLAALDQKVAEVDDEIKELKERLKKESNWRLVGETDITRRS